MTIAVTHSTPADSSFSSTGAAAWNADHTLTGVGTIAEQDANAVAITGGTIDGTVIGGTTPAAGTFTTLTATGQTSLGGAAGSESLRVLVRGSSDRWLEVDGGNSGTGGVYGTASLGSLYLSASGGSAVRFFTNGKAITEQFRVSHTASAVNYVQVTGAATGGYARVTAQGSDTNVPLYLASKNSAEVLVAGSQFNSAAPAYLGTNLVNYWIGSGGATGNGVRFQAAGSDTNISQVFQSKGTGAIDLAAGSRGVNISNGGTVTAITGTAGGSYTTVPTFTISAPTTAGGVQATGTCAMAQLTTVIAGGGTGYTVNDVLTFVGGTGTAITVTVTTVSSGVITGFTVANSGTYTVLPTNPISVTGGTGSGATFNVNAWQVRTTGFTITNAGSGYVEQPTVSFSSGSAAAYATVGSGTVVRSLGSTMSFNVPTGGTGFQVYDTSGTGGVYWSAQAGGTNPFLLVAGSANASGRLSSSGTGGVSIYTNTGNQQQLNVAHTASAVNFVQVTGAATGGVPIISAQGSDATVPLGLASKGAKEVVFYTNGSNRQAVVLHTAGAIANYATLTGNITGSAPVFGVAGSDTNIDLTLTPKGTGNVRFGTLTASADAPITGYITIKDSGGTVRKLAVIA